MALRPPPDVINVPIEAVMHSPVVTVERTATLRQASDALRRADVGTLAVVNGVEIAGILSERDVTRALADGADPDEIWVADVMSEEPRYATPGDTVDSVRNVMLSAGIRHLPVVDDCELVGMVSMRDVLGSTANPLSAGDADALRDLLDSALNELTAEIADTDNASFRSSLRERREHLQHWRAAVTR